MMDREEILDTIKRLTASEREVVRATTQLVLEAIKATGGVSLMPAPHLPRNGILMMVHPEVYDDVRNVTKPTGAA